MLLLSMCDKSYMLEIFLIIKIFLQLVCYIVPSIIIIISIINLFKAIQSGKQDDMKDILKIFARRIIAGLIVIFIPTLVNYVFTSLIDGSGVEIVACMESATQEKVESLKEAEEAAEAAEAEAQAKEDEEAQKAAYEEEHKNDDAKKEAFESAKQNHNGSTSSSTGGISGDNYQSKLSSMSTPSTSQLQSAASSAGISSDYLKIVIGTTANEGYVNDPYLYYGWASAMLNHQYTISQMQSWDPSRSGESNYYSQTNINKGYNNASDDVLKSVYLALTQRNTKIVECNGMYSTTPSSYNLLYASSVYNCSIYETK